jgi:hypothetical protein
VSNGSSRRLSRGDRRRNDKLARLRAVVTRESAVLAFDFAADKQVCALTDQDSQVLARRTVRVKAWQLHETVEWGLARAAAAGFSSVVVRQPTGHRWRVLDQIAAGLGVRLICVHRMLVHRARRRRTSPGTRTTTATRWSSPASSRNCAATRLSGPTRPGPGCGTLGPVCPAGSGGRGCPPAGRGSARVCLARGANHRRASARLHDQCGELQFVEDLDHPGFHEADLRAGVRQVGEGESDPFEKPSALIMDPDSHLGGVSGGIEEGPHDRARTIGGTSG